MTTTTYLQATATAPPAPWTIPAGHARATDGTLRRVVLPTSAGLIAGFAAAAVVGAALRVAVPATIGDGFALGALWVAAGIPILLAVAGMVLRMTASAQRVGLGVLMTGVAMGVTLIPLTVWTLVPWLEAAALTG